MPSRINDIESRHRRPILSDTSRLDGQRNKKQRFEIHHDSDIEVTPTVLPSSLTITTDTFSLVLSTEFADNLPNPDPTPFLSQSQTLPNPDQTQQIDDLLSQLSSLQLKSSQDTLELARTKTRLSTITLENTTLANERQSLWTQLHRGNARIATLENTVNVLRSTLRSALRDNEEMGDGVMKDKKGSSSMLGSLDRLVKDEVLDGEEGEKEGLEERAVRVGKTVIMLSESGMLVSWTIVIGINDQS